MTKVMRKYQKWILAVGGSLLMVGWLLQGVMGQMSANRGNEVVAMLGDRKVKGEEFGKASFEFHYLKSLATAIVQVGAGIENDAHYFLLSQEATAAGLVGDVRDGQAFLPQLQTEESNFLYQSGMQRQWGQMAQYMENSDQAKQMRERTTEFVAMRFAMRDQVAGENRLTPEDADRALARFRGILRLMNSNNVAARMSDRYSTVAVKRLSDVVVTDMIVVPASRVAAAVAAPTEDELKAHFEKYRAIEAAKGDDGIGYVQPPRVKLEWITLDKVAITAAVALDPIEVRKRFEQNRPRFAGEFATEKPNVEAEIRAERSSKLMDAAEKAVRLEVQQALEPLPKDGALYRTLPADWDAKRPKLEAIAQRVVDSVKAAAGTTIPLPKVEIRAASWITQRDLSALPGIGTAAVGQGAQYTPIGQLIFAVRELSPEKDRGVQKNVPFVTSAAADGSGNRYFFTVLDARAQSPADTLDEVREAALSDWKRLRGYARLLEEAEANRILAAADGLDAIVNQFPGEATDKPLEIQKRIRVSKQGSQGGGAAASEKPVLDAIFNSAALMDPLSLPTEETALARTFAAGAPKALSLVVGQALVQEPLTIESLRAMNDRHLPTLRSRELTDLKLDEAVANPFSFEALKTRLRYKPVREAEEEEQAKKTASK